jgi:putative membrane protein
VVIGLLSIAPTIQFVRWSRQVRADPAFQPAAAELKRAQSWVGLELLLIFPLVALAAAMARYPF